MRKHTCSLPVQDGASLVPQASYRVRQPWQGDLGAISSTSFYITAAPATSAPLPPLMRPLQVANNSDVIFVAVKPQHVSGVLQELRPVLKASHTIVSIAAGITLET